MSLGRSLRSFAVAIARSLSTSSIDTLAKLNAIVGDATLDDSGDPRIPTVHTHVEADITDLFDNGITLDGPTTIDTTIVFDRPDLTTAQGIDWKEGGLQVISIQQGVGTRDLVVQNSNTTASLIFKMFGSVITESRTNTNVTAITRGNVSQTLDLHQYQKSDLTVLAFVDKDANATFPALTVTTGPIIWGNGTGQPYHILQSTALSDGLAIQGQDSATNSFVNVFTKDGDATDFTGYRVISKGSPSDLANQEQAALLWEPVRLQFELATLRVGTGIARDLASFSNSDTDQWVLKTGGTGEFQGVEVFTAVGDHRLNSYTTAAEPSAGTAGVMWLNTTLGQGTLDDGSSLLRFPVTASVTLTGRKTADQSFTNDITLADITGVSVSLEANKNYDVAVWVPAATGAGGLKTALNGPVGSNNIRYTVTVMTSSGAGAAGNQNAYDGATGSNSSSTTHHAIQAVIENGGTAGTLTLRAAQNNSNGAASTVQRGAVMIAREIT